MPNGFAAFALLSTLVLAACGDTALERGVTGAAGGAVAGEVLADDPLLGAGAGAALGAGSTLIE
jgi:hypothetical protein